MHWFVGCLLMGAMGVEWAVAAQWRTVGRTTWNQGELQGMEVGVEGTLHLVSFDEVNFALKTHAWSDNSQKPYRFMVTDGNLSSEWTFYDDPQVRGRTLTIDLEGNRLVNQVRIFPGQGTAVTEPEFFIKGYRIHVAPDGASEDWQLVAEQPLNGHPVIDTMVDSTWKVFGDDGPVPVMARYLRLTITREDQPNRVSIGEIEVYGTGFQARGEYVSSVRDFRMPVNVGVLSWTGTTPLGTRLRLQLRTSSDNVTWPSWDQLQYRVSGQHTLRQVAEPVRYAQFRVLAETEDPLTTPSLESVTLDYDSRLIAQTTRGVVRPRQATIGAPVSLSYQVDVEIASRDRGVDFITLDRWGVVEELQIDGVAVPPQEYIAAAAEPGSPQATAVTLYLQPEYRLAASAELKLIFTTAFFTETSTVGMILGTTQGGVATLQRVSALHPDSLRVEVVGVLDHLVPPASVRVAPPVIRPGGEARIRFDLGRVTRPVPVSVAIFDLSGRCVCRLLDREPLYAGPIAVPWDGCAADGRPLLPGIYLYRIEVEAQQPVTIVRTLGIAY